MEVSEDGDQFHMYGLRVYQAVARCHEQSLGVRTKGLDDPIDFGLSDSYTRTSIAKDIDLEPPVCGIEQIHCYILPIAR